MSDTRKKDNLTDLVDVVASSGVQDNRPDNGGEVSLPTGDKVTLGINEVAKLVLKSAREKVAIKKYLTRKAVEKHLKQHPRKGE